MTTKERRRQLAREKFERQQQRRAQQRRRVRWRRAAIAGGLAAVLAAGAAAYATGLGGDDKDTKDSAAPSASPSSKAPDPCDKPAEGKPSGETWKKEPALSIDKSASYTMELETTCGDIEISMDAGKTPRTVNSFEFLAGEGYFDHTKCHRMTQSGIYVLQCGDPQGTGQGGPGYTIPDENLDDPSIEKNIYPAGTVAMANRYNAQEKKGRDTGGSQFFLVYQDSELPPDYTPFGKITGGEDVLKKIANAGVAPPDATQTTAPNATVVINKATVRRS